MRLKISFEKKYSFAMSIIEPRICRALLWNTAPEQSWLLPYNRAPMDVRLVSIDNIYLAKLTSLSALRAHSGDGAFCQVDNLLYIRMREDFGTATNCTSYPWWFDIFSYSTGLGLTDGDFFVSNGIGYKTGLLTGYKLKISSDDNAYDQVKFTGFNFELIWEKIKSIGDSLIGSYIIMENDTAVLEKKYIENTVRTLDTLKVQTKDLRASLKQSVLDQKFMPHEFDTTLGTTTVNAVDQDVLKTDKSDAIGYCVGSPATCMNGDQKNGTPNADWRYYRVCYGSFSVDAAGDAGGVEVKMDAGWKKITSGYTLVDYTETYPSGNTVVTKLLRIPAAVVHPAKNGSTDPDYECTPREVRVTGTFHTERGATITRPLEIIKYLFERYTYILWNNDYFNLTELTAELAPLNNAPMGIFIGEATELFQVIGKIQNGSIMGFKFTEYAGKFTARLHNPNRAITRTIKAHEIINLYSLEMDNKGGNYVSDGYVQYAKVWSEKDVYAEVRDEELRRQILNIRNLDKTGGVETLLKNEADAKTRFNNFMNTSKNVTPRISGIKLNGEKYSNFREYEIVNIDFGDLTPIRTWYILNAEFDVQTNACTIDVMAKL
ncbi:hypothetical protein AGMMS49940_05850 [Spirochaetia bacterium]|nr:hypothetical protein AGMMS49940_05850 [Spirochaetia bacterium]